MAKKGRNSKNTKMFTDNSGKDIFRRDGAASKGSKYFTTDAQGRHTSVKQKSVEDKLKPVTTANKPTGIEPRYNTINPPRQKALPNKTGLTEYTGKELKNMGKAQVVQPKALPAPKVNTERMKLAGKVAGKGGMAGAVIGAGIALSAFSMPSGEDVIRSAQPKRIGKTYTMTGVGSKSVNKPLTKGTIRETAPVKNVDIRKKRDYAQEEADRRTRQSVDNPRITTPEPKKRKFKIERADVWKDYFND